MKVQLELNLDYYRFQNLFLINLVVLAINIGVTFFEKTSIMLTIILTVLNVIFTIILFSKKTVSIENDTISLLLTFLGYPIRTLKTLSFSNKKSISHKSFISKNNYQKEISYRPSLQLYDPSLHVDEDIIELYIDNNYFTTLYSKKTFKKFMQHIENVN
ncbi:hypothetical protein ACFS5J_11590 [Flavobacterium chuncheonense]|uniref:Uncharacterized protein n=1 Tax=Flavobacterium chuncheonense TaxID=2026653 RepID=A0ABW5YP22_9FLAO